MKDANEKASRDFVQGFDTDTDEIDRLLFSQITDKESFNENIQSYTINTEAGEMLLSWVNYIFRFFTPIYSNLY